MFGFGRKIGIEQPINVVGYEKGPVGTYKRDAKYRPADQTGSGAIFPKRVKKNAAPAHTARGKGSYDHAGDGIASANTRVISQGRAAQTAMRAAMFRPIHNRSRKLNLTAYTNPLQDIVGPFARNRQAATPSATRAFNRGTQQVQPSVRTAAPQTNIPTAMPWNTF